MVASLAFRTNDGTRWGGGNGSDLSATQVDLNFWTLFSAVQALEDHDSLGAGIDYINQPNGGNLFYVHLTDHRVLGPFTIPTAQWTPQGAWAPFTPYAAYDVVSNNGSAYLIPIAHTSGATFSPLATDGLGHLLYVLLLEQPANMLPEDGVPGQKLIKSTSSPFTSEWANDYIRIAIFIEDQPLANEVLVQFAVTDNMSLPAGLIGTVVYAGTPTQSDVAYPIYKNGAAIGSIEFDGPSPEAVVVTFPDQIDFVPGDILTVLGPSIPDAAQSSISITLLATLTI